MNVGLDAKQNNDYVYVATTAGVETILYHYNTEGIAAMRTVLVPGQATNYYLDFQVPISAISAIWAGFTSATPVKIFYGTSSTNVSINKDWMVGSVVDFSQVATTKFDNIASGDLIMYTISGNTGGVNGATLSYDDGGAKTATADAIGNYSFSVPNNWSGTVTPSATGYTFSPTDRSYISVVSDQTSQDYTISALLISGNAGVAGAVLSYTDGTAKTATADGTGNYSFWVSYNWSGTVTPTKSGYVFTNSSTVYNNVVTPKTNQNYTAGVAPVISGNTGAAGVTLTYNDGGVKTVTSDGSGNYSVTVSNNWTGTLTPSKTGYAFSPANYSYNNLAADQTNQDFSVASIQISGNTTTGGVTLSYNDGGAQTAASDGSGDYSFSVSNNWTGTVTPSKTGYTFSPENRSYNNLTTPQTAQNYSIATVHISGNAGVAGVVISYNDGGAKTVTADGRGDFSFWVTYDWSGSLIPSLLGYTFSPASITINNVTTPQSGQDFTATAAPVISGNTGVGGVTLSYTDGVAKTITSDGSGDYSFSVSNNWTGTITPAKTGYTFSPVNREYTGITTDQSNQNYSVATVLISGNVATDGAVLSYTDGTAKTVTSDAGGNYSVWVSYDWTGSITPSKTGYTFSPANKSYSNVTSPKSNQDFSVETLEISGNTTAGGVTLSYDDGGAKSIVSDGSGNYSFYVSNNWTGTVIPSKTGYTFSPAQKDYAGITVPQTNQDYSIATVTISGNTGISGVTLSYNDGGDLTAISDGSGNYSFTVNYDWTGTVSPSKTGYTFSPASKDYTNQRSPADNQNFSVSTISISGNTTAASVTLSYTDGVARTTTSDESGNYSFFVSNNWTGTVTPSKTGYTFSPDHKDYTTITTPQTNQDYTIATVLIAGNTELGAVKLSYNNGGPQEVTSDGSGAYSIWVPYDWSGTITPSKLGFTFFPASSVYNNIHAPQTNENYSISTVTISGNAGIGGATLSYHDGSNKTVTADGSGNYSFSVSNHWTGTVTVSKTGYQFNPANKEYTNIAANQINQDYTVSAILIEGNTQIGGVTLAYNDGTDKTVSSDGTGNYSFWVPVNWTGSVTPSKDGYTFGPAALNYTNAAAPQSGQNFNIATLRISGTTGTANTILSYFDVTNKTVTSNGSGLYSLWVTYNWSGTVTPAKPGYIFNPVNLAYLNITVALSGQDFIPTIVEGIQLTNPVIPGGGTINLVSGGTNTIIWNSININKAKLEYSTNSGTAWSLIADNIPSPNGPCSYAWKTPATLPQSFQIKISKSDDPAFSSIQNTKLIEFKIVAPNGGEQWMINSERTISWFTYGFVDSEDPHPVPLSVWLQYSLDNGATWVTINDNINCVEGINNYLWTTPTMTSTECKVRIIQLNHIEEGLTAYIDASDNCFTLMQNSQASRYIITSPNNKEVFKAGTYQYIEWKRTGGVILGSVLLEYSIDGGKVWTKINTAPIAGVMRFSWLVPNVNSSHCLVRMSNYLSKVVYDVCDKEFTIISGSSSATNYPNPFNPATRIKFILENTEDITLTIYNSIGQVVKELASGRYEAGIHEVEFNASRLSSGVYYYELRRSNTREIHKMLLVK